MSAYARHARALAAPLLLATLGATTGCAQAGARRGEAAGPVGAESRAATPAREAVVSAPVRDVRYEVTYDENEARRQRLAVRTRVTLAGDGPLVLSLPAWTPGAYEISNFARHVHDFAATAAGRALDWDKVDYDTWRIDPAGAREVEITFSYVGNTLDNAMTWMRPDFAFFNGTNVFHYPEGQPLDFASTVTVRTSPSWRVATGMPRATEASGAGTASAAGTASFTAPNYHDLVDYPVFVGRIDVDSVRVGERWARLATYPAGALTGTARIELNSQIARSIPVQAAVFGETPFADYTTLIAFPADFGGGSALEHANSHLGIYDPQVIGNVMLPSITVHEIFHAWNVKRLRPADLVPYRYAAPQQTTLLWVSEGITDYYADLTLVRAGIATEQMFYLLTAGKVNEVDAAPPVSLEDASLSTWIQPSDGTATLYYPKGSLAGLLLDVIIRDASDNRRSLDDVMRELYRDTHSQRMTGFTDAQFWAAASRAAGGRSLADFRGRYVDGRDPYPYESVLPLAGIRVVADTQRVPVLGVTTAPDSAGIVVTEVDPAGAAARAGVEAGDYLVSVGTVQVTDPNFGARFREQYASRGGRPLPIVVRRAGRQQTLNATVVLASRVSRSLAADPNATPKAARVRQGIFRGTTEPVASPTRE